MIDHPDIVRDIHDDYFLAGADIAIANTYAVLRDRLQNNGIAEQFEALHQKGREIACAAWNIFRRPTCDRWQSIS